MKRIGKAVSTKLPCTRTSVRDDHHGARYFSTHRSTFSLNLLYGGYWMEGSINVLACTMDLWCEKRSNVALPW